MNDFINNPVPTIQEEVITLRIENKKLKADKEYLDKVNNEQTEVILKLNEQIERISVTNFNVIKKLKVKIKKMEQDQKTAYTKGMRHFAKAMKEYDRTKGAWTDYFEHTVDEVLKQELEK